MGDVHETLAKGRNCRRWPIRGGCRACYFLKTGLLLNHAAVWCRHDDATVLEAAAAVVLPTPCPAQRKRQKQQHNDIGQA